MPIKFKKIFAALLALLVTSASVTMSASAAGVIPEKPISDAELIAKIQSDVSYTVQQKESMIAKVMRSKTIVAPRSIPSRLLSNYPQERQQGTYWCVPASVRMVVQYKVSRAETQSQIAKAIGVSDTAGVPLSNAVPYINRKTASDYIWSFKGNTALSTFQAQVNDTLSTKKPVMLSTTFTKEMGFPYTERYHHAISIIGQSTNATSYTIRDPNNKGQATNYTVSASSAFQNVDHYVW